MTFEVQLKTAVTAQVHLVSLIDEAARTERYLSKPRGPTSCSMYDLLATNYQPGDWSYYEKALMKLRATPRQVTRWEFAIDVKHMIKPDISKESILDRKLVWMKANRFKWSKMAKLLGKHRTTLRLRYERLLEQLARKVKAEIKFDKLNKILYLI